MSKWFEGKADAPSGTIPGVGNVGPGVRVQARDDAHEAAIKATGHYKAASAPKVEEGKDGQPVPLPADAYTLTAPAAPAVEEPEAAPAAETAGSKLSKKEGN